MSKCSKCRYGWFSDIERYTACQYLLITGNVRGCPAGDSCTRFEPTLGKKWRKPKTKRKEDNSMAAKAKLTEEQKRSIVTESQAGAKVGELAVKYEVSKSSIHRVLTDYNEHGERCFNNEAPTFEEMHDESFDYDEDTHRYEVTGDTDIEAYMADRAEKEPETAATETGSEQDICEDIPVDIIPDVTENVKPVPEEKEEKEEKDEPLIPQSVIEACWARIDDLRTQIAAEQRVIDDWEKQIAEIKEFLELARIANPWEVQHES